MVHELPDENGRVQTQINTSRAGYFVSNFDTAESVTLTPQGGGTIDIVLPPGAKVSIPDKIGNGSSGRKQFQKLYIPNVDSRLFSMRCPKHKTTINNGVCLKCAGEKNVDNRKVSKKI